MNPFVQRRLPNRRTFAHTHVDPQIGIAVRLHWAHRVQAHLGRSPFPFQGELQNCEDEQGIAPQIQWLVLRDGIANPKEFAKVLRLWGCSSVFIRNYNKHLSQVKIWSKPKVVRRFPVGSMFRLGV